MDVGGAATSFLSVRWEWWTVIAGILTGIGTGGLAFLTYRAIRENRKLIAANNDQVTALKEQEKALVGQVEALREQSKYLDQQTTAVSIHASATRDLVTEMERERDLDLRPHLTRDITSINKRVRAKNIGRGPAINCRYYHYAYVSNDSSDFRRAGPLFHLGPNGDSVVLDDGHQFTTFWDAVFDGIATATAEIHVFVCEDVIGNKFRFIEGHAYTDLCKLGTAPESIPKWARWY